MLAEKRRTEIVKFIEENGSVSVHDLSKKFDVTLMTINRDLKKLHHEGKLKVVRGGAMSRNKSIEETYFSQRINDQLDIKELLAEKAIKYIEPRDSIILDSSTTAIILSRKIIQKGIKDVTILTNSNTILNELLPYRNISVISTGGILLNKFHCYAGPLAELVVSQIRANKFFFSVAGVTSSGEITDTDIQEVNVKKKMIEVANKKILMVGSHKFNKAALYKVADIKDMDLVICDGREEGRVFVEEIKNKGINVEF